MAQSVWSVPDGASPVLMLRSLPEGTTEGDLMAWGCGFSYEPRDGAGRIIGEERRTNVTASLVLKERQLGFVQLDDIWAARAIMTKFVYEPRSIHLTLSGKTHALNIVYSDKPVIKAHGSRRAVAGREGAGAGGGGAGRLLLAVLREVQEEVSINHMFWIFSQFGRVEKLSSFAKNGRVQLVIQFTSAERATLAMAYLNGRTLHATDTGHPLCIFSIIPSKLTELTFRNQDSRNKSYAEMNQMLEKLLRSEAARTGQKELAGATWQELCAERSGSAPTGRPPQFLDFIWGERLWGDGWLYPKQDSAWRGQVPPPSAVAPPERGIDTVRFVGLPDEQRYNAEFLWQLCGLYGDVCSVRAAGGGRYSGSALVQMATAADCRALLQHLSALRLSGQAVDVQPNRQPGREPPRGAALECGVQPPRDPQRLSPPGRGVVAWDVPPGVGGGMLCDLFGRAVRERGAATCSAQHGPAPGGNVTVWLRTADAAVQAATALNGAWVAVVGGSLEMASPPAGPQPHHPAQAGPWQLKLRFAPPHWRAPFDAAEDARGLSPLPSPGMAPGPAPSPASFASSVSPLPSPQQCTPACDVYGYTPQQSVGYTDSSGGFSSGPLRPPTPMPPPQLLYPPPVRHDVPQLPFAVQQQAAFTPPLGR